MIVERGLIEKAGLALINALFEAQIAPDLMALRGDRRINNALGRTQRKKAQSVLDKTQH
ncbi:hypothetical protein ACRAWG_10145 [Methylobacterium sp. P31]